jgi:thioredoxin-related protein
MKILLNLFVGLLLFTSVQAQDEVYVDFKEGSWEEVVAMAAEQGKYIMVDAYTDWCYWCKVMDKNTFRNEDVVEVLDESFISYKINCEKGIGTDFNMKFRIAGFPTLLFFNPNGQAVGRAVGYESDNEKFIGTLKEMLDVKDKQPYAYDGNNWDPGFPDFYKKSYKRDDVAAVRINADEAMAFLDGRDDLFGEVAFSVMSRSALNDKYMDFFQNNYDKYNKMYGSDEAENVLTRAVYGKAGEALKAKDYDKLMAALDLLSPLDEETQEQMAKNFKGRFYQTTGDWDAYVELYEADFKDGDMAEMAGMVNSISWTLYEGCDDKELLHKACKWMKEVVASEPSYAYLDTYAALCYKTGDLEMGHKWATKAIKVAKENDEDPKGTEELMKKFEMPKTGSDDGDK